MRKFLLFACGVMLLVASPVHAVTYQEAARFDANGVMVPLDSTKPTSFVGEVILTTAAGKQTYFRATANTDAARGAALKLAETAHVDGDVIKVGNGTFEIASPIILKPKVHLDLASGSRIKLADQGGASYSGAVIRTNIIANNTGTKVTGGIIDCNLQGQTAANAVVGGVALWGSGISDGVTYINWGSKWAGVECFIIFIGNYEGRGAAHDAKAINNIVHTPAPITHLDGSSAIGILGSSALTTPGNGWMIDPEISGNVVSDITTGTGSGKPTYFHAYGVSSSYGAKIHDNQASNLNVTGVQDNSAIYFDQWSNKHLTIQNNTFTDVGWGLQNITSLTAGDPDYVQDDWVISGNHISSILGGVALTPTTGQMTRVVIKNNVFSTTTSAHNATSPYGLGYVVKNINGLIVEGNVNDSLRGYQVQSGVINTRIRNNPTSSGTTAVDISSPGFPQDGWADEVVSFIPPSVGWYRIANGSNGIGGDITIVNTQTGHLMETMFHYEVAGYGLGSSLTQSRMMTASPAVTQARVSSDGAASVYLDIYVAVTDAINPLIAYSNGSAKLRGKLVASPTVGAVSGSTSLKTLTFVSGIATTDNVNAGGNMSAANMTASSQFSGPGAGITGIVANNVTGNRRRINDANYAILAGNADYMIEHENTTAARTDTLPAASGNSGQVRIIKDVTGNAATYNLNLSPAIEGATQKVDANFGSLAVYSDGSVWRVQSKYP